ncbi:MAG: hypothetical protein ACHQF4_02140 [Sphingobacteriales bacterium]
MPERLSAEFGSPNSEMPTWERDSKRKDSLFLLKNLTRNLNGFEAQDLSALAKDLKPEDFETLAKILELQKPHLHEDHPESLAA